MHMHSLENRTKYNKEQQEYFLDLFTQAMNDKKYLKINKDFYVTIDEIWISHSGCHHCNISYDSINLRGKIYVDDDDYKIAYDYYTDVSSYYIMCNQFTSDELSSLLFNCDFERKNRTGIRQIAITKDNVEIVDEVLFSDDMLPVGWIIIEI